MVLKVKCCHSPFYWREKKVCEIRYLLVTIKVMYYPIPHYANVLYLVNYCNFKYESVVNCK